MRRLEENIGLVERGRLEIPAGADAAIFLLSDGKLTQPPKVVPLPQPLTLGELRDQYVQAHSLGAMEANSLQTVTATDSHDAPQPFCPDPRSQIPRAELEV
jgi:hypothetical protein